MKYYGKIHKIIKTNQCFDKMYTIRFNIQDTSTMNIYKSQYIEVLIIKFDKWPTYDCAEFEIDYINDFIKTINICKNNKLKCAIMFLHMYRKLRKKKLIETVFHPSNIDFTKNILDNKVYFVE